MGLPTAERFHAMDALRAAMMLAVVVLHAAMFFADPLQLRAIFRFADPDRGPGFATLAKLLNAASMPAFFLAAGFFTAMLVERRGARGMLVNRLKRITLPFLVVWPLLYVGCVTGLFLGCLSVGEVVAVKPDDLGVKIRHLGDRLAHGAALQDVVEAEGPRPSDTVLSPDDPTGWPKVLLVQGPAFPPDVALVTTLKLVPVAVVSFVLPEGNRLVHVWFLFVLTLFAVASALLAPLMRRVPTQWLAPRLGSFAFPFVPALLLAPVFLASRMPYIPPAQTLLVPPTTLAAYGLSFLCGALFWRHRDRLDRVGRWWPVHLALALAAFIAAEELFIRGEWDSPEVRGDVLWVRVGMALCGAIAHTQLVWAMLGLFRRFFGHERAWVRSLSDASYWIYLVHLPLLLWLAALLVPWDVSRFVKFPLYVAVGFAVPLATYHLFVRRTRIGAFLNGRRSA